MTTFPVLLHKDSAGIVTSFRHGDLGDTTEDWHAFVKSVPGGFFVSAADGQLFARIVDGGHVSIGAVADAAVTDPAASASVLAALKGILADLRLAPAGLMKAEDAVAASGDSGVLMLAIRRDAPVTDASAAGDYTGLHVDNLGRLRTLTTELGDATNATTAAYEASLLVKASAGKLWGLQGYNSLATPQFIQVHDALSLPADASVPKITLLVGGTSNFSFDFGRKGRSFATGIVICNSSTGPTKTVGLADCWFDAQYE